MRSYTLYALFQECTSQLWCTKRRSLDISDYITFIPSNKHARLYFLRYRFYAIFTFRSGNNVIDCTSSYIQHHRNVCVRFSFRVVENHKYVFVKWSITFTSHCSELYSVNTEELTTNQRLRTLHTVHHVYKQTMESKLLRVWCYITVPEYQFGFKIRHCFIYSD